MYIKCPVSIFTKRVKPCTFYNFGLFGLRIISRILDTSYFVWTETARICDGPQIGITRKRITFAIIQLRGKKLIFLKYKITLLHVCVHINFQYNRISMLLLTHNSSSFAWISSRDNNLWPTRSFTSSCISSYANYKFELIHSVARGILIHGGKPQFLTDIYKEIYVSVFHITVQLCNLSFGFNKNTWNNPSSALL